MRIVVELKRDANAQVVLNRFFAQTQLQTTFAINMLALVKDQSQPKILSLREILDEYLSFQGGNYPAPYPVRPEKGSGTGPPSGGSHHCPGKH